MSTSKKFTSYKSFKSVPEQKRAYILLKDGTSGMYYIVSNNTDSKIIYTVERVFYYDKIETISIYD